MNHERQEKKNTKVLVPLLSGSSVFTHRRVYGGQVVWRSAELGDWCLLQFRLVLGLQETSQQQSCDHLVLCLSEYRGPLLASLGFAI